MCAILDANVAHEVFGPKQLEPGAKFLEWILKGQRRLVIGGKVLQELAKNTNFVEWSQQARLAGYWRTVDGRCVNKRASEIQQEGLLKSDDPHVLALAQLSGARLLYSNDKKLHKDFKDTRHISDPSGKVYSTLKDRHFSNSHKGLLRSDDLCGAGQ